MPNRTVKHAMVSYSVTNKAGQVVNSVVVPRGDTHDFPQSVIDRYEPHDAFLKKGETLQTIGEPRPLDEDADQSDVDAWLAGVSAVELLQFMREHAGDDDLLEKLGDAANRITDARSGGPSPDEIPPGFGVTADGATTINPAGEVDAEGVSTPDNTSTGNPEDLETVGNVGVGPDADGSDDHTLEPAQVVAENVDFISGYLSRNPEMSSEILEAENERAESLGKSPRQTVIRAVEVAAGHTD